MNKCVKRKSQQQYGNIFLRITTDEVLKSVKSGKDILQAK